MSFTLFNFIHWLRMKTNTQDGRHPIPPSLCPTQDKNWKMSRMPPTSLPPRNFHWKCRNAGADAVTWLKRNLKSKLGKRVTLPLPEYRYKARKNSCFSAIWLAAETKIHLFLCLKLAEVWLKDGRGMEDQEKKIKNKKYWSLKMFYRITTFYRIQTF